MLRTNGRDVKVSMIQDAIEIDWNIDEAVYKKPACNVQTTGASTMREALAQYFLQNPI